MKQFVPLLPGPQPILHHPHNIGNPADLGRIQLPGRRRFMQASAALVASMVMPVQAMDDDFWNLPRELWLRCRNTGVEKRAVYWADGQLIPEGYVEICQLLKDTHMNLAVQMDLAILDILRGVYGWLCAFGMDRPLIVYSGYRHPSTNATEGGVRNSQHIYGKAVDVHIEGVSADAVTKFGLYLAAGGVGYYPSKTGFTHLDSGRLRTWRG